MFYFLLYYYIELRIMSMTLTPRMKFVIMAVVVLLILVVKTRRAKAEHMEAQSELGAPDRKDAIEAELTKLNGFKNGFSGSMDPLKFKKQFEKKVRQFEIDQDVRILRSSMFTDGPLVVKEQ